MRRRSYAVWWQEGHGPRHAGKFELESPHALLSGNGQGRLAIPLEDITGIVYVGGELLIGRSDAAVIRIGSLDAPGALLEVTESLRWAAAESS